MPDYKLIGRPTRRRHLEAARPATKTYGQRWSINNTFKDTIKKTTRKGSMGKETKPGKHFIMIVTHEMKTFASVADQRKYQDKGYIRAIKPSGLP